MSARSLKSLLSFGWLTGVASAAIAAPPNIDDYAQGVLVQSSGAAPMVELALPDPVYQTATRTDLRDLRVFNADGAPVPHAFCAPADVFSGKVTQESLPVFELKDARRTEDGGQIDVQTATGTQVSVREPSRQPQAQVEPRVHIIDARGIEQPLRAIHFDWESPDGASQAKVRIEASEDLDQWRSIVASSTLLRAGEGARTLRRERIPLPSQRYRYLRVQRADGGPALIVRRVIVERLSPEIEIEPMWFLPNALATREPHILHFDTARVAPVRFARLRLALDNSSMNVTLQSRADEDSPWIDRWSGETYLVATDTERRESPPARFDPTTDRYWRAILPREAEGQPRPTVEFAYRPTKLRFLAQGPAPYTLAFGSRRAELANPARCEGLLADVSGDERRGMIAQGVPGAFKSLGGQTALEPPPRKTPTRVIVLWAVLIVGVGLLVAMALSLLGRVRPAASG